jgi:DNA-binding LacI/PurR family transcriptional regulator
MQPHLALPEIMADKGSIKLTLADIAERAGVSRSLASLALRGEPGVQPEKRARILKIAAELNYTPNPAARNLASNVSRTVGILVADILNPYLAVLAKTIDGAARAKGFDVVLSVDGTPDEAAQRAIANLMAQRIAGMVLIGAPDDIKIVDRVARRIPVVYVGRHLEAEAIDSVSNDDRLGSSLLVRHLVECGHKRIAHIDGGRGAGARRRREGFQVAMRALGLEPQVIPGRYTLDGGSHGAKEALAKNPRPTAIFAANDLAAIGVLNSVLGAGFKVPGDIAVVGYDDMPFAASETLSLTTMHQPIDRMATQCIDCLIARIQDPDGPGTRVLLSPHLVVRRSTLGSKFDSEMTEEREIQAAGPRRRRTERIAK